MIKNKVLSVYKKTITRFDKEFGIKYFEAPDFNGLEEEKFDFFSNQNERLSGFIYNYANYDENKVVIFAPGIGPGHVSYMREIELLAKNGLKVITLDYTGTGYSDGENIRSMTQSLADLDALFNYLKSKSLLTNKEVTVIGHSFGGFAAGNIRNYQDSIKNVVVISGYVSVKQLIKSNLTGINKLFRHYLYSYEKKQNIKYFNSSSLDALKNDDTNFMIIHSKDDEVVNIKYSAYYLFNRINKENVHYVITKDKFHNPNYTKDAVNYMRKAFTDYYSKVKDNTLAKDEDKLNYLSKYDWIRMTEQDPYIWKDILKMIKE